jgi:hypothetical protein
VASSRTVGKVKNPYICRMRYFITAAIVVGLALLGWRSPQRQVQVSASSFPWEPVGPNNLGHNLHTALRVGNTLYIGSAFGGLFRSTDGGRTWSVVPGFNLNQNGENTWRCPSVTTLATDGTNLYVGTAAAVLFNPSGVSPTAIPNTKGGAVGFVGRPGMGVFVSTDGGNTFAPARASWDGTTLTYAYSSTDWTVVTAMDAAHGKVLVATHDTLYMSSDNLATATGLNFKSTKRISTVAWGQNDSTIFVTNADSLFRSTDGGRNFQGLTSSLPRPTGVNQLTGGNVVIARAPSDPRTLYVATANASGNLVGVWVSRDNGDSWTLLCNPENTAFAVLNGRGTGPFALAVDPQDPLHIVIGGSQLWEFSPDLGWRRINPPNQDPFLVRLPNPIRQVLFLDNNVLLVVGDGRPVRVTSDRSRVEDASQGIQATRVLSVAVSSNGDVYASGPSPLFITNRYPTDPLGGFRLINRVSTDFSPATSIVGYVVARQANPAQSYFSYEAGRIRFSETRGNTYYSIYNVPRSDAFYSNASSDQQNIAWCPASGSCGSVSGDRPHLFGPLYPPIALAERFQPRVKDQNNQRTDTFFLFAATGGYIWTVTYDTLFRWNRVSNQSITNLTNAGATYADYVNTARSIPTAIAFDSSYTVWVGTSDGKLYRLKNAHNVRLDRTQPGNGLEDLTTSIAALINGRWISAIAVHPNNPDLVAIATGSYNGTDRIFLSQDATSALPTFTSIQGDLPKVPVYALFFHPDSSHLLLAGTEWGLWRCTNVLSPTWEEMTGEAIGRIPVTSITWKPYKFRVDTVDASNPDFPKTEEYLDPDPERPIFIGTWGRGVWKLSSRYATGLPLATATQAPVTIRTYPNPFSQDFTIEVQTAMPLRQLSYQLYTIKGDRVHAYTYQNLTSGIHHLSVQPGGGLSAGTYILTVEAYDTSGRRFQQSLKLIRP